jgi:adenosyl cobinamide kinase/adenosyl cobinamide phosphate guanylyltransferase
MDNAPSYFRLALILGGARSGKSRYGLGLAARCPAPRLFVATCEPRDAEMEARIDAHQRERGSDWRRPWATPRTATGSSWLTALPCGYPISC